MYAIRYKELVKKDEGINNNMAKKRDKKNKLRGKWLRGIIIVYLLLILCNLFHEFPSRLGNLHSIPVSEEWYLIVVNRWNEIPEYYVNSLILKEIREIDYIVSKASKL